MAIKAVLIDDHQMLLRGLTLLFDTIDGIDIVGTSTDGAHVRSLASAHDADIVITDAAMPGTDGLGVVHLCAGRWPVLVLTSFDDARLVSSLINAGASGYILKDVAPEELARAIKAVVSGGLVLDPRVARYVQTSGALSHDLAILTRAERLVAELVAQGKNNKEIAAELVLAEGTVKNHVSSLLRKLDARDRTMLALRLAKSLGHQEL